MPLLQGLIPLRIPSLPVGLHLPGLLARHADLLVHLSPVLVKALLGAVNLCPTPGAPVNLFTAEEALVTFEGATLLHWECGQKQTIFVSKEFGHLFEASPPLATDQGPIFTHERLHLYARSVGHLGQLGHHLNNCVPFAAATPPPGLAHAEDLHQMGVGHQVVAKGIKNLVPD